MPPVRSRIAVGLAAVMIIGAAASCAEAQQGQPNLRMLLNLDLFAANPNGDPGPNGDGGSASNGTMLEQIQTLQALGLLDGNHGRVGPAPSPPPAPEDSSDQPDPEADRP